MLLGLTLVVLSFLRFSVNAATVCNGHTELCDRSYGNITYVGAHNSYAVGVNNLAANQDYDLKQQLNDGVRLLQMQAHENSGDIYLCHTAWIIQWGNSAQLPQDRYETTYDFHLTYNLRYAVQTWMDAHPEDVVTLLIVNSDNLAATQFASVYVAAGVDSMSYSPKSASLSASSWPTLGSLIDAGTRLVTFLSTTASFDTVPYLIDEFSNVWETPFNTVDNTTFQCKRDRGTGDTSSSMYLINHFLDTLVLGNPIPDVVNANLTNAANGTGSLGEEVAVCGGLYNRYPNFLLVDYYEYGGGSVFQVAATANRVTYTGTVPTPKPTSGSGGPQTSSVDTGSGSGGRTSSGFGMATLFAICCVIIGAFSVFI
ncbi:hypothetical protein BDM02DRAFT_1761780 [Thelephora ganbajun]|uniref:Uncharacterized protein n=1 Tax=Thelephora ganbajun TaxID=370292 RepID=A0ACB6ZJH8_THEGA|nr:hypothetical protein BDM02DRAFT_1761780 [Thelephora ganbajun]